MRGALELRLNVMPFGLWPSYVISPEAYILTVNFIKTHFNPFNATISYFILYFFHISMDINEFWKVYFSLKP